VGSEGCVEGEQALRFCGAQHPELNTVGLRRIDEDGNIPLDKSVADGLLQGHPQDRERVRGSAGRAALDLPVSARRSA
jgi:hypothetical protein